MLEVSLTHVLSFYVLEYKKIGRDCEFMKVIGLVRVNAFVFGGAVVEFFHSSSRERFSCASFNCL